jgi:tetratricopeptide (TPR) repeat protein
MKKCILGIIAMASLAGICWFGYRQRPPAEKSSHGGTIAQRGEAMIDENALAVVKSIYLFKNDCGLWPYRLDELIPNYIESEAIANWHYQWEPSNWWQLTKFIDFPDTAVRYERSNDCEGWQLTDGIEGKSIDIRQPMPEGRVVPEEELTNNMLRQMRTRILAEPNKMLHYQGEVCWFWKRNRLLEARSACVRCLNKWPDHFWPIAMLAMIDSRLGHFAEAEDRLTTFIQGKEEFSHSFLLAQFYLGENHIEKALAILQEASSFRVEDLRDGMPSSDQPVGMMADVSLWRGAVISYRAKRYDTALRICDQWERFRNEKRKGADASYYTIRSACHLAMGQFDLAQAEVDSMIMLANRRRYFGDDIDELAKAIQRKDTRFVYETQEDLLKLVIEYD